MFESISNLSIKAKFISKDFFIQNNIRIMDYSLIKEFDQENFLIPNQTHSTNVILSNIPGQINNCDGVFTTNPKITCLIKVADCMPIYFAHKNKSFYGIVHAGWRGLTNGVLNATSGLLKEHQQKLKNFDIFIGPSIQSCCFEICNDIVEKFPQEFVKSAKSGKFLVDMQKIAVDMLRSVGFNKNKITISDDCTFCLKDHYYSYRRENEAAGRMIGLIGYKA